MTFVILYTSTHMEYFLTSAYLSLFIKLIFFVVISRVHVLVCSRYIRMKSKQIHIRMEVKYFEYNAHSVCYIFVQFHLQLIHLLSFILLN